MQFAINESFGECGGGRVRTPLVCSIRGCEADLHRTIRMQEEGQKFGNGVQYSVIAVHMPFGR